MKLHSFYHVAIKTHDLRETERFYRQFCDADVVKRKYATNDEDSQSVNYIVLSVADKLVYLFDEAPYAEGDECSNIDVGFLHYGFVVDDVESAIKKLRSSGIDIIMGPEIFGDLKIAFFTDPAGVRIELLEHV